MPHPEDLAQKLITQGVAEFRGVALWMEAEDQIQVGEGEILMTKEAGGTWLIDTPSQQIDCGTDELAEAIERLMSDWSEIIE